MLHSQIFHGVLTHVTKCCACGAQTHTDGAFWHLPLALVDSDSEDYSVVDGVEEHFKVTHLSGENRMYCDDCEAKSDAAIKCVMKHHPDVLMLLLKRFRFDYYYMTYVKINQTVDVPYTLQIPEDQTYELYAVVEHFGNLRFGHYTATIRVNESWYEFSDARVTKLNIQVDHITKSNSAYLLFYKRNVHVQGTEKTPGGVLPGANSIYDQCQDALKTGEREEAERAAESCDDRNDTTGIEDMGSDTQAIQDHVNKQDQNDDAQRREMDE